MARYRDGYKGGKEKYDFSIIRGISLLIIPIIAYTIGLFPIVLSLLYIIRFIDFSSILGIFIFTLILVIEFFLFIIFETFIPGLFIRLSHLKVDEGAYDILKLVGLKMGKSSVVAGSELIHDPYMVEIGEQTLIGGWSQITGHLGEKKLIVKKVKIGDNCLIGGKSFVMPGVNVENNVTVALNSVVLKDTHLEKNTVYGGTPVKKIGTNK